MRRSSRASTDMPCRCASCRIRASVCGEMSRPMPTAPFPGFLFILRPPRSFVTRASAQRSSAVSVHSGSTQRSALPCASRRSGISPVWASGARPSVAGREPPLAEPRQSDDQGTASRPPTASACLTPCCQRWNVTLSILDNSCLIIVSY
jgi:hypothetical protein